MQLYGMLFYIKERRQERILEETNRTSGANPEAEVGQASLKNPDFVPATIFEKNISPGILKSRSS